jgi:hypothetical protein
MNAAMRSILQPCTNLDETCPQPPLMAGCDIQAASDGTWDPHLAQDSIVTPLQVRCGSCLLTLCDPTNRSRTSVADRGPW